MALFGGLTTPGEIDREPELRDRVMIFAYLEELMTLGSHALLEFPDALTPALSVRVEDVSEGRRTFELSMSRALPGNVNQKTKLMLSFTVDRQRFLAQVGFKERGGYLKAHFGFPDAVRHDERRQKPRARFTPRDGVSVTALESLFSGNGIQGRLLNLSMGGACVRVDRALAISGQKRIAVNTEIFRPGAPLDLVRIQDLPHIPLLECSGSACHLERTSAGVILGLRFEEMDSLDTQLLAQSLKQRLPPDGLKGFPVRYPKSRRQAGESEPERSPSEAEGSEVWADVPDAGPEPVSSRIGKEEAMKRIRKRGKRILIVALDDLDRAILAGTLHALGYPRVGEAKSYIAASQWLRHQRPDLLVIEHPVGMHSAQQVVEKLRSAELLNEVPVLMLAARGDVRADLMAKAARIDAVLHHAVDFDGEGALVIGRLLGVEPT